MLGDHAFLEFGTNNSFRLSPNGARGELFLGACGVVSSEESWHGFS